jgi:hypothetical protein
MEPNDYGTLAKLNIDFDLMSKTILEIIFSYNIEPNDYWIILNFLYL